MANMVEHFIKHKPLISEECSMMDHFMFILFFSSFGNSSIAKELRDKLTKLAKTFQEDIRPVWKNEFISLYCFLPW